MTRNQAKLATGRRCAERPVASQARADGVRDPDPRTPPGILGWRFDDVTWLVLWLLVVTMTSVVNAEVRPVHIPEGSSFWRPPFGFRPTSPHPAVVRVVATEPGAVAQGSGALVDVHERYGLVVTNWHVVRDAMEQVTVVFPDGFRSAARTLKVDSEWDLAALLIWRPQAQPIPIATVAPRPGDILTIAGYGQGRYRAATGRCTQYVAPGTSRPYEMVELSAQARQGDSGGPIFNARGELAGILFGSSGGTTSGSYCGRVQRFLEAAWPPQDLPETPLIASRDPAETRQTPNKRAGPASEPANLDPRGLAPERTVEATDVVAWDTEIDLSPPDEPADWRHWTGDTPFEQSKSFLAGIGLLTVLVHFSKFLLGGEKKGKKE